MKWSCLYICNMDQLLQHIFKIWRRQRFIKFLNIMRPSSHTTLLDVGGSPSIWEAHRSFFKKIICLNLGGTPSVKENIEYVTGDGTALDYQNKSFDIVFSNSVIEHVGSFERQQAFAKEIRRVGKKIWLQTPAYECPFEPHFLFPFMHWLPQRIQRKLLPITPFYILRKPGKTEIENTFQTLRLLTKKEMRILFPDCTLYTEKIFFLFPKSYVAYRA